MSGWCKEINSNSDSICGVVSRVIYIEVRFNTILKTNFKTFSLEQYSDVHLPKDN